MIAVILQFIPLALAAITPTMVVFVTALLPLEHGPARAVGVVTGRLSAHLLLAFTFTYLLSQVPEDHPDRSQTDILPVIFLGAGIVLLLAAAWVLIHDEDPDKPPSQLMQMLKSVGPITLFVADFVIVLFSLRLMSIVIGGSAIIKSADLSTTEELVSTVLLAALMVWPMLVPLAVYASMGSRRDEALASMGDWLSAHETAINVAVLAFFGGVLVTKGIAGL